MRSSLGIKTEKRSNYCRGLGHDFEKGRLLVLLRFSKRELTAVLVLTLAFFHRYVGIAFSKRKGILVIVLIVLLELLKQRMK